MKCIDCRYLTPKAPLPGFPYLIGYCAKTQNLGLPCFVNDTCPDDAGARKTKNS